jgi:hypothetical protein
MQRNHMEVPRRFNYSSTMEMEAIYSSETLVDFCQVHGFTYQYIHSRCCEDLKDNIIVCSYSIFLRI